MSGDLLDLILIGLMIAFAVSGYRQGFIIGAMSFIGFVGGVLLGVFIAPPIAGAVIDGETERALLAIVIVFLTAIVGQFASSTIGAVIRSHVTWEPAKVVDAVGGTFASALAVLIVAWFIGSLVAFSPFTFVNEHVNRSVLLGAVDHVIPQAAKGIQQPFKQFIDTSGFPQVFEGIGAPVSSTSRRPTRASPSPRSSTGPAGASSRSRASRRAAAGTSRAPASSTPRTRS
nr:hypothetical protein GCM10020093_080730 [Planobispora longispora]